MSSLHLGPNILLSLSTCMDTVFTLLQGMLFSPRLGSDSPCLATLAGEAVPTMFVLRLPMLGHPMVWCPLHYVALTSPFVKVHFLHCSGSDCLQQMTHLHRAWVLTDLIWILTHHNWVNEYLSYGSGQTFKEVFMIHDSWWSFPCVIPSLWVYMGTATCFKLIWYGKDDRVHVITWI